MIFLWGDSGDRMWDGKHIRDVSLNQPQRGYIIVLDKVL